uniref:hypothetical protein n=1 Tax=Arctium tomentosum TaxID=4218 RepID=UPI001D10A777|nr:hypothetical protein LK293_mgp079 [Arctium tomentosum]YP_010194946.1 hypothetical protein LK294_mgp080 [Arctium lappa]QZZ81555.1 hypothetical protein [Arctium tomentosum]QZZ81685.1 hypothetical protein [Arctium lappa]
MAWFRLYRSLEQTIGKRIAQRRFRAVISILDFKLSFNQSSRGLEKEWIKESGIEIAFQTYFAASQSLRMCKVVSVELGHLVQLFSLTICLWCRRSLVASLS